MDKELEKQQLEEILRQAGQQIPEPVVPQEPEIPVEEKMAQKQSEAEQLRNLLAESNKTRAMQRGIADVMSGIEKADIKRIVSIDTTLL